MIAKIIPAYSGRMPTPQTMLINHSLINWKPLLAVTPLYELASTFGGISINRYAKGVWRGVCGVSGNPF